MPVEDKAAIEYLRKLGYVEESNLLTANICHPTNLPATILSPDELVAFHLLQSFYCNMEFLKFIFLKNAGIGAFCCLKILHRSRRSLIFANYFGESQ